MLMIFFVVNLLNDIEKRARNFRELLDPTAKVSLVNTFKSIGISHDDLYLPVLNYSHVE